MRRALARDLRGGMRVLEVGTGPYAVLALWAVRRYRLEAIATEIEPMWAERARDIVARHGVSLEVRTCDLASGIAGPFDSFLTLRGVRTLFARIVQHESNAQAVVSAPRSAST